jgi:MscS family membrane protein
MSSRLVTKTRMRLFLAATLCAASAIPTSAQLPGVPGAKPAVSQPPSPAPVDPAGLGRETPRGTVIGFIRAAQEENNEVAVQYFQPTTRGHHVSAADEQELVPQLLGVLNARFPASALDNISRDPQVMGQDAKALSEITIGGTRVPSESFPLYLVNLQQPNGPKLWFISQKTLEAVPSAYFSLHFPRLEKELPSFLVKNRLVGMPLWQWVAIILLAPVAMALGWLVALISRRVWQLVLRWRKLPPLPPQPLRHFGPGAMLVAVLIHYNFVFFIGTSILYRQYYQRVILVLLAFAFYWAVTRVTHWIFRNIWLSLTVRGLLAERSLVSLSRRVLDVVIFVLIALAVLAQLDVNVTAALAGLGIGGLAIGLGAQKTFENLLGGISILTDKAVVVGDACRIGDQTGVVEDIGLRSTKLRTENRTLVSIPNGTVATATLENFRLRDKILFKQVVRLRYDLSPDHVRYVLGQIYEVLVHHAKVEEASARVRLLKFGEYAIEVEIYAYILERDYGEFLAVQEHLVLLVMETLDRTGATVALPSQTTMVTQDKWVDPEKAAAAQRAVEKSRDPGVPGAAVRPELAPDGGAKRP